MIKKIENELILKGKDIYVFPFGDDEIGTEVIADSEKDKLFVAITRRNFEKGSNIFRFLSFYLYI